MAIGISCEWLVLALRAPIALISPVSFIISVLLLKIQHFLYYILTFSEQTKKADKTNSFRRFASGNPLVAVEILMKNDRCL